MAASNNIDEFQFLAQILSTPEGREVVFALVSTWHDINGNLEQSLATARQVAKDNGTLASIEAGLFAAGLHALWKIVPLLYQSFQGWMDKQGKK